MDSLETLENLENLEDLDNLDSLDSLDKKIPAFAGIFLSSYTVISKTMCLKLIGIENVTTIED